LAPGLYRIGALMPENGANPIVSDPGVFQSASGVGLVRFLRQIGSPTLAMPDIGPPYPEAIWFGPTFTFTIGPLVVTPTVVAPSNYTATGGITVKCKLIENCFIRSNAKFAIRVTGSTTGRSAKPALPAIRQRREQTQIRIRDRY